MRDRHIKEVFFDAEVMLSPAKLEIGIAEEVPNADIVYNSRKGKGESIDFFRFPIGRSSMSRSTFILKAFPIVPRILQYPAQRSSDGILLMVDDDRFCLRSGEGPVQRSIRFRTLG